MKFLLSSLNRYLIFPFLLLFSLSMPYNLQAQDGKVQAVKDEKLKALLPDTLENFKTRSLRSFSIPSVSSMAKGIYKGEGNRWIQIVIYDIGAMSPENVKKGYGWTLKPIGTTEGVRGTIFEYNGHKAKKRYSDIWKRGEFSVFVGGRFVVEIYGNKMKWATIEKTLQKIDLKKLETLGK